MSPTAPFFDTRLFICAPVPFEDLRFHTHSPNALLMGLVHSFEASIEGPGSGKVTVARLWKRTAQNLIFPATKFYDLMRGDLKIPPGNTFNFYYETAKKEETCLVGDESSRLWTEKTVSWVPSHGLYLEGCDDSMTTLSWRMDLQGEYEVTTFSYEKCRVLTADDILRLHTA